MKKYGWGDGVNEWVRRWQRVCDSLAGGGRRSAKARARDWGWDVRIGWMAAASCYATGMPSLVGFAAHGGSVDGDVGGVGGGSCSEVPDGGRVRARRDVDGGGALHCWSRV